MCSFHPKVCIKCTNGVQTFKIHHYLLESSLKGTWTYQGETAILKVQSYSLDGTAPSDKELYAFSESVQILIKLVGRNSSLRYPVGCINVIWETSTLVQCCGWKKTFDSFVLANRFPRPIQNNSDGFRRFAQNGSSPISAIRPHLEGRTEGSSAHTLEVGERLHHMIIN